jgi:histidinol phosphatase-like PHP family hydrolase
MERVFSDCARVGVGIELNMSDMSFEDSEADQVLRMYRIAKSCGCKFYCGSDAHHPEKFDTAAEVFNRAIDLLGLEESDKFIVVQ